MLVVETSHWIVRSVVATLVIVAAVTAAKLCTHSSGRSGQLEGNPWVINGRH